MKTQNKQMSSLNLIIVIVQLLVLIMGLTTAAPTLTNTLITKSELNNNNNNNNSVKNNTVTSSPAASSVNSLRLRKRHRKRHSNWDVYNNFNENSTLLEWSNPCGGVFDPSVKNTKRPNKKEQKRVSICLY